ncbi:MAG: hypothetical protein V4760_18930 [Bdellovibrionota bacterium]
MVKRIIALALVFTVTFLFVPRKEPLPKSEAAIVLAAPVVAIGALELALLVLTAAVLINMISQAQHDDLASQVHGMIESIKTATGDAVKSMIEHSMLLMTSIAVATQAVCLTEAILRVRTASGASGSQSQSTSTTQAATCAGTMDSCCGNFFSRLGNRMRKGRGGVQVFRDSRMRNLLCCFEWDSTHKGLEIFNSRGEHLGERGCDDSNDDPCSFTRTRGPHAMPSPNNHRPTSGACRP